MITRLHTDIKVEKRGQGCVDRPDTVIGQVASCAARAMCASPSFLNLTELPRLASSLSLITVYMGSDCPHVSSP